MNLILIKGMVFSFEVTLMLKCHPDADADMWADGSGPVERLSCQVLGYYTSLTLLLMDDRLIKKASHKSTTGRCSDSPSP